MGLLFIFNVIIDVESWKSYQFIISRYFICLLFAVILLQLKKSTLLLTCLIAVDLRGMKPELISNDLCPFVQCSVITLLEKNIEFDVTYIDLERPPTWFLETSPLAMVPILKHNGSVLFESAVINEYIDEIAPPSIHPNNSMEKANNRSWIRFSSRLIDLQTSLSTADSKEDFTYILQELSQGLKNFEKYILNSPFFNGEKFSLVDAAIAPFFLRLRLMETRRRLGLLEGLPNLQAWSKALIARPSVINSVRNDFNLKFLNYIKTHSKYAALIFAR